MRLRVSLVLLVGLLINHVAAAQTPNDLFRPPAVEHDQVLANSGDIGATLRLGYQYMTGAAGTLDRNRALAYFQSVSSRSTAATAWANYMLLQWPTMNKSKALGPLAVLNTAANSGDPVAKTLLGRVYDFGLGHTTQDRALARSLYEAVGSSFALAQAYLAESYMREGNVSRARDVLVAGAAAGEPSSMRMLAQLYMRPPAGVNMLNDAKHLLLSATARGDSQAIYELALLYRAGRGGMVQDQRRAFTLSHTAALQGYVRAQLDVAECYENGVGVKVDPGSARFWRQAAAKRMAAIRRGL